MKNTMMTLTARCLFALLGLATLYLAGCASEAERQRSIDPVDITLKVVDKNGAPLAGTTLKVTQQIAVGTQLFCVSISTFGGGGKNCTRYKDVHIFKGQVASDGIQHIQVSYRSPLKIRVAAPCITLNGKNMRPYFWRLVPEGVFLTERTLTLGPVHDPQNGFSVDYEDCRTTTPPLEYWENVF
ncbi:MULTISPECIES: hypothetical protein [unclassified Pseudomonas]|uniref:hypothetical protein n=1 Tax=unclassified Pseudomonas TaxID=196821 RepID=UPI000BDA3BEA|nr:MULTISPECIES: hypothetical protein [unclassified Pseudomonas]PVZ10346.1 hypothetical protein F474_03935 [Pseudomonas sp. URIL14HWK12:I12]PVZ21772.1 hypothetical protein F470_03935 [Pseudomonas sp. URIL14HWK12:I10]PVZ31145.1 hypothetical protein F472_04163 [Pseudomonas sp. URIL14HWK12:I11]SNZ17866.1 hypothetical protein SAMN05660463_03802 [Pseudomonas sp. URIL14HWK12:I9]